MLWSRSRFALLALAALMLVGSVRAAGLTDSLQRGTPDLKSAGALAFGPEGVLFVGDTQGAAIFAIDTGDRTPAAGAERPMVEAINEKLASLLGIESKQLQVNDLAVNPISGNTYLSLSRGRGPEAKPVIVRVDRTGKISEQPLKDVKFAKVELSKPAAGRGRADAITHMAYVDGRLLVAGLSNEEFSSRLRAIPVPFKQTDTGAGIQIYHGSHGRIETKSPVRKFVAYDINGEANILAAYTCTPLVRIPVSQLKPGAEVKGKTIAELGNRNRPLDMIVYKKGGKDYILMANSSRGVMKIPTEGIDQVAGITARVRDKAGLGYETIAGLKGVMQLDRLDNGHAIILVQAPNGALNLRTMELP